MSVTIDNLVYHELVIELDKKTDIWLSCEDGHLVQKENGVLNTSVLAGCYYAIIGTLKKNCAAHFIVLNRDMHFTKDSLKNCELRPLPLPRFRDEEECEEPQIVNGS